MPYIPLQTVAAVTPVAQPTYNSMLNNSHGTTTAFFATPSSNALQSNVVQAISSSNGNCNKVCIDSTISAHMKQFARILPKGSDIHNLKINSVSYMQPSIQLIPGSVSFFLFFCKLNILSK